MNRRHFLATLGVASMSSTSLLKTAWAASYPSSPVRIVVPYAAGGGADGVTRVVAQLLGERLKGSFIVDNRPGAGGVIGAQNVARADADGYTLLMAGNPELTITPHLLARAPYSVADAFTPIMLVAQSPNVFVGNPAGPRTLAALIEESRKRNAPISVGTPGIGTPQHLAAEVLASLTGAKISHVPYKGAGPAVVAALSGEIQVALVGAPPALPHIKSERLAALAVTQVQRSPLLPQVPTVGEAMGLMKDMDYVAWYGLLAPARTPQQVVQTLEEAVKDVLDQASTQKTFTAMGTDLMGTPSAAFAERIRNESRIYAELIKKFGIQAS